MRVAAAIKEGGTLGSCYRLAARAFGASLLGLGLASLYSSCASNRSIVENHPLERSLASYHRLGVDIAAGDEKCRTYISQFTTLFLKMAREKSGFAVVGLHDASKSLEGLRLKLTIIGMTDADFTARAIYMGGEAEVTISGVLMDGMSGTELSSFQVKGNSHENVRWGKYAAAGGALEDVKGLALSAASQQITEYLTQHQ